MRKINYSLQNIELNDHFDVIVCGGGPAGVSAAYSAAKNGVKTLLIESQGCLGGMSTSGLIPAWCPFSDGEKIVYRGFASKVFEEAKKGVPFEPKDKTDWVAINPEHLKRVYDSFIEEAGVEILFFTNLCAVDVSKQRQINFVLTSSKDGIKAWRAKIFIDCTGDADLAYFAGARVEFGDQNNNLQASTLCFCLGNVDTEKYLSAEKLHPHLNPQSPIIDAFQSGKYPLIPDTHICQNMIWQSVVGFNAGHIYDINPCSAISLTKAMIIGRKMAYEYKKFLSDYMPEAFASSFVSSTASLLGVRESRRIVGKYVMTIDDYINRKSFPDEIGRNSYYIDVHDSQSPKQANNTPNEVKTNKKPMRFQKGESHGIPFRALIPKNIDNMLVAGRCISTDRLVNGAIRIMPVCLVTGQAAGTAAALCIREKTEPAELRPELLRSVLKKDGAYFI